MNLKKPGINGILICLIIILGAVLRFWNYSEIPYMYDELGALFRTRFSSFSELISNGVNIDGHPAFVQVFLFYFTRCFGYYEMGVKLPFILMGIASIYLAYWIGKTWFSEFTGLMTAVIISTSEYTLMYSQIIRPYASGMFFTLAMVVFWTLYIRSDKKQYLNLAGMIVTGALCAYNHHFSMLMSFIIGLTGLFMIKGKKLFIYIGACVVIMLLYVPHINITLHQMGYGGIGGKDGWLAPPTYHFLFNYVNYIFHFSGGMVLFILALIIIGAVRSHKSIVTKYRLIALAWFCLPLAIGFYYSRLVNPVLQYSVLIFSFPFLLIFLFSFLPETKAVFKLLAVASLAFLSVYTLRANREYYTVFYKQGARETIVNIKNAVDELGEKNVAVIVNCQNPYHIRHYEDKFNVHPKFLFTYFNGRNDFITLRDSLKNTEQSYLAIGLYTPAPLEYINVCKEFFPYIAANSSGFGYEYYLLSKKQETKFRRDVTDNVLHYSRLTFEQSPAPPWSFKTASVIPLAGTQGHVFIMDSTEEYGPQFSLPISSLINSGHNFVSSSAWLNVADTGKEVMLVFTITDRNGEVINWSATPSKEFVPTPGKWTKIHFGMRLSCINLAQPEDMNLTVYIWNKGKGTIRIDDFDITVSQGNPTEYSLYYDF